MFSPFTTKNHSVVFGQSQIFLIFETDPSILYMNSEAHFVQKQENEFVKGASIILHYQWSC